MNDLISRQAAIKAIEDLQDCPNRFSDTYDKACIIEVIEEVPSIEPAKHGTWEDTTAYCGEFTCSVCKEMCVTNKYKWCPHCGAKMGVKE